MAMPPVAEVLRVFVGELDKHGRRPLYEVIVEKARERGLAGATVVRGIMGFGASGSLRKAKALRLVEDVPVVIEIVDSPGRIAQFLSELDGLIGEGLVTVQEVRAAAYRESTTEGENGGG